MCRQLCGVSAPAQGSVRGGAGETLTTNGLLLAGELAALGLDGVNISLNAAEQNCFTEITGFDKLEDVNRGIDAALAAGLKTKLNCVLLAGCENRLVPLARYAEKRPIDVRFIEVMPIGAGAA